jgi:hypothetical protein
MAITRIPNTRSASVSRKAKRLAVKSKRLAAKRAKASAVVVEPASFKMRLLRGAGGLAFAVAAAPIRLLLSQGIGAVQAATSESKEQAKHKRRIAILKRHEALREMVRAEHALNMARIELDHADAKLAKLEKSTAQPSLWSSVSTAAMYVGAGAVMGYNPQATMAAAGVLANGIMAAGTLTARVAHAVISPVFVSNIVVASHNITNMTK